MTLQQSDLTSVTEREEGLANGRTPLFDEDVDCYGAPVEWEQLAVERGR